MTVSQRFFVLNLTNKEVPTPMLSTIERLEKSCSVFIGDGQQILTYSCPPCQEFLEVNTGDLDARRFEFQSDKLGGLFPPRAVRTTMKTSNACCSQQAYNVLVYSDVSTGGNSKDRATLGGQDPPGIFRMEDVLKQYTGSPNFGKFDGKPVTKPFVCEISAPIDRSNLELGLGPHSFFVALNEPVGCFLFRASRANWNPANYARSIRLTIDGRPVPSLEWTMEQCGLENDGQGEVTMEPLE